MATCITCNTHEEEWLIEVNRGRCDDCMDKWMIEQELKGYIWNHGNCWHSRSRVAGAWCVLTHWIQHKTRR